MNQQGHNIALGNKSGGRPRWWLLTLLIVSSVQAIEYEYDGAGRLSRVVYDSGVVITYSYDASGNLLQRDVTEQVLVSDIAFNLAVDIALENDGQISLTVNRGVTATGAASIDYTFTDGTATNGADYSGIAGSLNWPDGDQADRFIIVPLIDDALEEMDETFTINLINPQGNAQLGAQATLTVTLLDDDAPLFEDGFED